MMSKMGVIGNRVKSSNGQMIKEYRVSDTTKEDKKLGV